MSWRRRTMVLAVLFLAACARDERALAPLTPTTSAPIGSDVSGVDSVTDPTVEPPTHLTVDSTGSTGAGAPDSAPPEVADTVEVTLAASEAVPGTDAPSPSIVAPPTLAELERVEVEIEEVAMFEEPIAMAAVPGDEAAVYLAERAGRIVRLVTATGESDEVADLGDLTEATGERGLLGIATAPDGGHLYVNYTDDEEDTRIEEFSIDANGVIDADSRRLVMTIEQPHANHNGGALAFGPDGYLYIAVGDGGSADDPERRALKLDDPLGKLLRIDPAPVSGFPYSVPPDNPFVDEPDAAIEIWSTGLRNPWRFSFDRLTGDLWIGDVGQAEWEEVSWAPAAHGGGRGASFGWSAFEGSHRFNDDQPAVGHTPPVWEYAHSDDDGCSITGGYVYRGSAIPALVGAYVFGDYCSGKIWALSPPSSASGSPAATEADADADVLVQGVIELADVEDLASFGEDARGELYTLSLAGSVGRLIAG